MDFKEFHFAHPEWLLLGLLVPFICLLYYFFYERSRMFKHLERFIDKNLLPYLLIQPSKKQASIWKALCIWSLVWTSLTVALASPRWSYREVEIYSRDQSLVILLDLSQSMDATDIKPSRLIRARQKIEDLINQARNVKIGIIAFAADPHMITPLTDDVETIRHLLHSLETDLVYVQGSKLVPAFTMASQLLEAEPGNNKAILVISDGGFEDASAITTAKRLAEQGVVIHCLGVGTTEGAPVKDARGNFIKKQGNLVLSKLEKDKMKEICSIGRGRYLEPQFSHNIEKVVLNELAERGNAKEEEKRTTKFWEEKFYLLLLPVLPIMLFWFRRGFLIPILLFFSMPLYSLEISDFFKNRNERGKQAIEKKDYKRAVQMFEDPYRKGVAQYQAGHYEEAEKLFKMSSRPEVAKDAAYNLGNALVYQQKLQDAITAYEDVLKSWPDHQKAKDNLELVKKMLEDQKNQDQSGQNNQNKDQKNKDQKNQDQKNQDQSGQNKDQKNQDQSGQNKDQQNQDQSAQNQDQKNQDQSGQNQKNQDQTAQNKDQKNQEQRDQNDQTKEDQEQTAQNEKTKEQQEQMAQNDRDKEQKQEEKEGGAEKESKDSQAASIAKSQEDHDADQWLNRIRDEPRKFLKNKFYIESKRNHTKEAVEPW